MTILTADTLAVLSADDPAEVVLLKGWHTDDATPQFIPEHIYGTAPPTTATANIASAGSLSGAVDLGDYRLHRILMPAGWNAAAITFQEGGIDGATYRDLYDDVGEYTLASTIVAASRSIAVSQSLFYGIRYLKIRSGTSAAVVNQAGGARALTLVLVPR